MKNQINYLFFASILIFSSCNNKNDLCVCIEKGDELNQFSADLLTSESISKEQEAIVYQLRHEVDSLCAAFKEMGPQKLYELRNECGDFPEP